MHPTIAHTYRSMTASPTDADGFHSIAWDDAPPSSRFSASQPGTAGMSTGTTGLGGGMGGRGFDNESDNGGFETVSTPSDAGAGARDYPSSSSTVGTGDGQQGHQRHLSSGTVTGERMHGQVDPSEWGGKWMAIDVRDPVKEHEGSKDMFVSYAVRTRVSLPEAAVSTKSDAG